MNRLELHEELKVPNLLSRPRGLVKKQHMTEKKQPFGALGNPYGTAVPDDVLNFFGADAPDEQPAVRWNEELEKAALEQKRQAEAERAAEAARELELARKAEAEAAALEARRREEAAEAERQAQAASAARIQATAAETPTGSASTKPNEPKTFGQTIRSHWDSLIDTLGIGSKAKAEKNRAREEAESRRPAAEPVQPVAASSSTNESVADTPTRAPRSGDSEGRKRHQPAQSEAPKRGSSGPKRGGEPRQSEYSNEEFGLGTTASAKSDSASNPLDSLFESDPPPKQPAVTDSRRRRPAASRPIPDEVVEDSVAEVSEDAVEFEVVDLAGEDISDLWERDTPPVRAPRPRREAPPTEGRSGRTEKPKDGRPRAQAPKPAREPMEDEEQDIPTRSKGQRESFAEEPRPRRRGEARGTESRSEARRSDKRRPAPAPVDDDDDGYTFDNSWVPDDPRDADAPKRRPVPTWRRVVDHVVDKNLANRRGGDGRRRSGGPPRDSASGAGKNAAAPARGRRENAPTYLDVPVDDFDETFDDLVAPEPTSRGGRRGPSGPREDWSAEPPRTNERGRSSSRGRSGQKYTDADEVPMDESRGGRRQPRNEEGRDRVGREPAGRQPVDWDSPPRRATSDRDSNSARAPRRDYEDMDEPDRQEPPPRRRRPPRDEDSSGGSSGRGRRRY